MTRKKQAEGHNRRSNAVTVRASNKVATHDDTSLMRMLAACEVKPVAAIAIGPVTEDMAITVGVPTSQELVHTYAAPDVQRVWRLLHLKARDEHLIVADSLKASFGGDIKQSLLIPAMTSRGRLLLWPIEVGDEGEWLNPWAQSARQIALGIAAETWVRVDRNKADRRYMARRVAGVGPTVDWSGFQYERAIGRAFEGRRFVNDETHPVFRMFAGEVEC